MEMKTPYAFGQTLDLPFAEAEFRNYVILGASNPPLAFEVISRKLPLGTLLPCNVVLYSTDDDKISVVAMDPWPPLSMAEHLELVEHAKEVAEKVRRMMAVLWRPVTLLLVNS